MWKNNYNCFKNFLGKGRLYVLMIKPQYINKKISKIEREFDTIIFNRTSNGLILTPKGILISNFAQKVIEQKRILIIYFFKNFFNSILIVYIRK